METLTTYTPDTPIQAEMPLNEGLVLEIAPPTTEVVVFDYSRQNGRMKPNQIRHSENMAIFTGFWHGSYYVRGQIQRNQAKL